jgi:hypothetical protein
MPPPVSLPEEGVFLIRLGLGHAEVAVAANVGVVALLFGCVLFKSHADNAPRAYVPLDLANAAIDAAESQNASPWAGDIVIVLAAKEFAKVHADGDLWPFVDLAAASGDDAVVILIPKNVKSRSLHAVFFCGAEAKAWSQFGSNVAPAQRRSVVAANRKPLANHS